MRSEDLTLENCSRSRRDREELAMSMLPYARAASRRVSFRLNTDFDEVVNECMIKVLERIDRMRGRDIMEPKAYLQFAIREGISSLFEKFYTNKRTNERDGEDVYELEIEAEHFQSDPILIKKIEELMDKFNSRERGVIRSMYWCDMTQKEAGVELGISQQRASEAHNSAMKKIREAIL